MTNFWNKLPRPFTVLAPMENVTDFVFREIVSLYLPKPDVLFTEFTNTDALNSNGYQKTIHRFKFSNIQKPIVAQIWGTNPENFFKSAKIAQEFGFDGVDINMGCPVKDVVKIGACSALIDNPNLAKEIIHATKEGAGQIPTSVKTRIGTKKVVTEEWVSFLLEQNIDALIIHGRTAKEMSTVPAHWDEIGKTVSIRNHMKSNTTIIGNGDIENYDEIKDKYDTYQIDGAMVGRGIFKNPWVFEKENSKHTFNDYRKVLIEHLNLYHNTYNGRQFDVMKKFFKMYIKNFEGASEIREKLMNSKTSTEAINILNLIEDQEVS